MAESVRSLVTRRTLAVGVVLTLVFVGLLVWEGRPAWCNTGLGAWAAAWTRCTSQHFLDPYALTHVLHGVIFYWMLRPLAPRLALSWRLVAALALEVAWEVLENSPWVVQHYRQDTAALDYTGDSILNSIGDVVTTLLGFVLASRVSWKVSLVLFIVTELGLLYFIRDNLSLNVIMLLFPLESLKEWQLSLAGG